MGHGVRIWEVESAGTAGAVIFLASSAFPCMKAETGKNRKSTCFSATKLLIEFLKVPFTSCNNQGSLYIYIYLL